MVEYNIIAVDNELLISNPTWYCVLNFSLISTTIVTSIELSALLGIIRYVKICLFKEIAPMRCHLLMAISIVLSLVLSSLFSYHNSYSWDKVNFYCLPSIDIQKDNTIYFVFFYSVYSFRILPCFFVICFCYFSIAVAYFRILNPSIVFDDNTTKPNLFINSSRFNSNSDNNNVQYDIVVNREIKVTMTTQKNQGTILPIYLNEFQPLTTSRLRLEKIKVALKIGLVVTFYMLSLLPDLTVTLLSLTETNYDIHTSFYSNCFLLCLGFTSSCFILLIHQPIQKCFFKCLKFSH
ncbi:hypothetical protein K502DRAFT_349357 [Neoconidiobolus thromboides FSU 785]|nr:hypothetical protein K502DRAFT_349357 [Neoconidiobolus thromboides FSU 785]